MNALAVIGVIVGIIGIILIIVILEYNKFQWSLIKLDKGEASINNAIQKKYNILIRFIDFLKENIKINEDDFEEYVSLNTKISIYKLDEKVEDFNNIINKYMDNNEKLLKNETIININKELMEVNIIINGCKKYYNDNLTIYNHLCNAFPSNIIGKIFKYKEKDFLDEEHDEKLKILDEEYED